MTDSASALLGGAELKEDVKPETTPVVEKAPETKEEPKSEFKFADEEVNKYVTSKGWKSPDDILKSYRNLEKAYSGSKNIIALPDEKDPKSVEEFFQKIGKPDAKDKYSLKPGNETEKEHIEKLKDFAFSHNLTDKQAQEMYNFLKVSETQSQEKFKQEVKIQNQREIQELQNEWGSAYETKLALAKQGMTVVGLDASEIDAMQSGMGLKATMSLLTKLGSLTGEESAKGLVNGASKFSMSPAEASEELSKLKADENFTKSLTDKNNPAHKINSQKWKDLHSIAFAE